MPRTPVAVLPIGRTSSTLNWIVLPSLVARNTLSLSPVNNVVTISSLSFKLSAIIPLLPLLNSIVLTRLTTPNLVAKKIDFVSSFSGSVKNDAIFSFSSKFKRLEICLPFEYL